MFGVKIGESIWFLLMSDDFDTMLLKVAADDVQSFKNNNDWLRHHPKDALIFKKPEKTWTQLKDTYQNDFKFLVYGEMPYEQMVLATISELSNRLARVKWTIVL